MADQLSPAAQAVLDAAFSRWMEIDDIHDGIPGEIAAAALRAAADHGEILYDPQEGKVAVVRDDLLRSIAAELEAS